MTATVLTLLALLLATAGFVVTVTIRVLSLLTALLGGAAAAGGCAALDSTVMLSCWPRSFCLQL